LVKTLHPIDEIAASVASAEDHRVRVTRERQSIAAETLEDEPLDPTEAVARALREPLDYPPLAAGIVPGDQVAIALDESVPQGPAIVRGAVESLLCAGIEIGAISIVTTGAQSERVCREVLAGHMSELPRFVVHDPDDNDNLCLVGVTKRQVPLLVNRTIFDADIVLPISVARVDDRGAYGSLFPRFSNAQSIERHRTPASLLEKHLTAQKVDEANEAGWLIGAPLVIEVVPGPAETVAHVIAGEPQCVARHAASLCRQQWALHSPQQVDLVIATITGGALSQTWANVGRALAVAEKLLVDDGAVAICSNLEEPPGESLGRLIANSDLAKTERRISHDHGADSWPAWHLARALQRGPVYLLSQLDAETVEEMGLAPVAEIAELARLADRHHRFILIEDSQHAMVTVDDDDVHDN
jgi:nickel-dependent lactate racemase